MADPTEVQPGDLITADLWNALVRKLNSLQPSQGPTGVSVPSVFGLTLFDARAALTLPGLQLSLSQVIDAFGLSVNASDSANAQRRVIAQAPPGGSRVDVGTGVSLVVAAVPSTGGSTGGGPPVIATLPGTAQATSFITIIGSNFDTPFSNNKVTFDGIQGAVQGGTALALSVQIPSNIPGLPVSGGQKAGVQVVVANHFNQVSNTLTMTVQSPPARVLHIDSLSPAETSLGSPLTIKGSGFGTDVNAIKVLFDAGTPTAPSTVSDTQLQVTIPTTLPKGAPGSSRVFQVSTQATGVISPSNNSALTIDF